MILTAPRFSLLWGHISVRRVVVSKALAYGRYLGAREHPSSAVLDRGSKHRTGATVSSRMAQSRYGSAGELLAWRPDRVGHEALNGYDTRGRTGPLARECSVLVQ